MQIAPEPDLFIAKGKVFDLETILPLASIRTHTKTDDVEHVTDAQLSILRDAAFEQAEKYTGWMLRGNKRVTEIVTRRGTYRTRRNQGYRHTLKWPTSDGLIYLYGMATPQQILRVNPDDTSVFIPLQFSLMFGESCCSPCGSVLNGSYGSSFGSDFLGLGEGTVNLGGTILYRAGLSDCMNIPSGIIIGVLRWITWCVEHPGDEILTVRNLVNTSASGILGTSNSALASGALELWRTYDRNNP